MRTSEATEHMATVGCEYLEFHTTGGKQLLHAVPDLTNEGGS